MSRFYRGPQLNPIATSENYASGAAGFPTKISTDPITQDGFRPGEELPAEYLNHIAAAGAGLYSANVDRWMTQFVEVDAALLPAGDGCFTARTAVGEQVMASTLGSNNDAHWFTEQGKHMDKVCTPATGTISFNTVLAWDNFVLLAGTNSLNANKALWRATASSVLDVTEGPTLTGAVAGDFGTIGTVVLQRDPEEGSVYLYTSTNDKCWRSVDNGATFTALAAPGRVRAWGAVGTAQNRFHAAQGYAVLADAASVSQITLRVFTAATGAWSSVNIFTQSGNNRVPHAITFSSTLQRWVYLGYNGTVATSADKNPASAWTVVTVDPMTAFGTVVSGFAIDNVVGIVTVHSTHCAVTYSSDLGVTWKGVIFDGNAAGGSAAFYWDGTALWANTANRRYKWAAIASAPLILSTNLNHLN